MKNPAVFVFLSLWLSLPINARAAQGDDHNAAA
jgi:hypothetical protein